MIKMFENKTICVLGGTGSIGGYIVEEFIKKNDKDNLNCIIRIVSNDENSLYMRQQEWGKREDLRYQLGDVRDYIRMLRVLKNVDYVFNCAAIKHVPFAEYNPMEAVQTNIIGLDNIINACVERKIKKLFHISTDKAVNPCNVMGATKLIGERMIQMRWAQNPTIDMVCLRCGNVFGSRGSIAPYIRECKKNGLVIKVTDPRMERYFIYPDELIELIFDCFENGYHGDIWVPKLKSTKIMNLVGGYPYEVIGSRKGEKLREELLTDLELSECQEYEKYYIIKNKLDDLNGKIL